MLRIGPDWEFPLDPEHSRVWLSPKGLWGIEVVCPETKVETSDNLGATLAPRLSIQDLGFDGLDWRDLVGLEIYQHGGWSGEGSDPDAMLFVVQAGDVYECQLKVVGVDGADLEIDLEGTCDVFFDDDHDTDVAFSLKGKIPFEGVRFRFRAEGAAGLAPEQRAGELLAAHLARDAFGPALVDQVEPGIFDAWFPPAIGEVEPPPAEAPSELSPEEAVLHKSAEELLQALVHHEKLEVEEGGIAKLVPGLVAVLEEGGRGARRAERVSEWLIDRDEVIDLHMMDDELGQLLDKFW